jgi:hypothetical protein
MDMDRCVRNMWDFQKFQISRINAIWNKAFFVSVWKKIEKSVRKFKFGHPAPFYTFYRSSRKDSNNSGVSMTINNKIDNSTIYSMYV